MRAQSISRVAVLLCVLSFLPAVSVRADVTIEGDPGSYATIQEAIDAAKKDDVILVSAGTFACFTITKALTIVGAGAGATVIEATEPETTCVTPKAYFVLEDLTFTGPGIGVKFPEGVHRTGVIRRCEFTGRSETAVILSRRNSVAIEDSSFHDNATGVLSIPVVLTAGPGASVRFERNAVQGNSGPTLITILGHPLALIRPALHSPTEVAIRNNLFSGNAGDVVLTEGNGQIVEIVNNTIVRNSTTIGFAAPIIIKADDAGALILDEAFFKHTIVNNIISGNLTVSGATTFSIWTNTLSTTTIASNVIKGVAKAGPSAAPFAAFDPSNLVDLTFAPGTPLSPESLFVADVPVIVPGTTSTAGDLHLKATAFAVDAGDDAAVEELDLDLDGLERLADGDGDTVPAVDMGCYELGSSAPPPPLIEVSPSGDLVVTPPDVDDVIGAIDAIVALTAKDAKLVTAAKDAIEDLEVPTPATLAVAKLALSLTKLDAVSDSAPGSEEAGSEAAALTADVTASVVSLASKLLLTPPAAEKKLALAVTRLAEGESHRGAGRLRQAGVRYRAAARLAQQALGLDRR